MRTVDIFVSRLDPATAESDLVDCVKSAKGNVNITDIQCQELQSKYKDLYSSFYVAVSVSYTQFKAALNLFL